MWSIACWLKVGKACYTGKLRYSYLKKTKWILGGSNNSYFSYETKRYQQQLQEAQELDLVCSSESSLRCFWVKITCLCSWWGGRFDFLESQGSWNAEFGGFWLWVTHLVLPAAPLSYGGRSTVATIGSLLSGNPLETHRWKLDRDFLLNLDLQGFQPHCWKQLSWRGKKGKGTGSWGGVCV